jgi:hypothetical protein
VIAAAIADAILLPTDECFAQEVPEHAYDCLKCPKYAVEAVIQTRGGTEL